MKMARWSVDLIRARNQPLGRVEAATEEEAIERAAALFNIAPGALEPDRRDQDQRDDVE
jgi:hypothetical protein